MRIPLYKFSLIIILLAWSASQDIHAQEGSELALTGITNFGQIHVLGSSSTGFVRVTNSGSESITLTEGGLTGASEFVLSSEPQFPRTLQPGEYMLWNFRFFPQEAGERSAEISVTSNAIGSPHSITLRAEGVDPPLGPWNWKFVGRPLGLRDVNSITIDQEDDDIWYVTSGSGLIITRDGGISWSHPLPERFMHSNAFAVDRTEPNRLYAGIHNELYVSIDRGLSWKLRHTLPVGDTIRSLTTDAEDGTIFVPYSIGSGGDVMNPGVYISHDFGATWDFHSFGYAENGIIPWEIVKDPISHALYIATEIADHPQPYDPPFFRSLDNGQTWEDVSGTLPWHGVSIDLDPPNQEVYFLTEGTGLFKSVDQGQNWQYLSNYFYLELLYDQQRSKRLYGGATTWNSEGGAFASDDAGYSFEQIGLSNLIVNSLALNSSHSKLYAASYGAGIFMTPVIEPGFTMNVGHSGAWFNPVTSGQGLLIDVAPEENYVFLAWFTYTDADSDTPFEHHWFTAQGEYEGYKAELILYETLGGRFDDPQEVITNPVGEVTLSFTDCSSGVMSYNIETWGKRGSFPLNRVIPGSESICEERDESAHESVDINAGMDGAWYEQDTSGQGYLIDTHVNPDGSNFIFVAWFTYGTDSASGHRWLTAQGNYEGSSAELDVYETTGGSFDDPIKPETEKIGTMRLEFFDCNYALLTYDLINDSIDGSASITRVIPGAHGLCEEIAGAD